MIRRAVASNRAERANKDNKPAVTRIGCPKSSRPSAEPARAVGTSQETTEQGHPRSHRSLRACGKYGPHRLIDPFPQGAYGDEPIPPPAEVLELRKKVEVTPLVYPSALSRETLDPREAVRDERDNAPLNGQRQCAEHLTPPVKGLVSEKEHRVLDDSAPSVDRKEKYKIKRVLLPAEGEPETINDRDELPRGNSWSGETPKKQGETGDMAAAEPFPSDPPAGSEIPKAHPALETTEHILRVHPKGLPAATLRADAPCPFAPSALSAALAKPIHPRPTARRFRLHGVHARDIACFPVCLSLSREKNASGLSTEFPCHTQQLT